MMIRPAPPFDVPSIVEPSVNSWRSACPLSAMHCISCCRWASKGAEFAGMNPSQDTMREGVGLRPVIVTGNSQDPKRAYGNTVISVVIVATIPEL